MSMSGSIRPDTQRFIVSLYFRPISVLLASATIVYHGLGSNHFQERGASMLTFIVAIFCHALALKAEISLLATIIFHASGATACEALLWILVDELWKFIIINVLVLLVAGFSFYYKQICDVLCTNVLVTCLSVVETLSTSDQEGSNDDPLDAPPQGLFSDQMTDLEAQDEINASV